MGHKITKTLQSLYVKVRSNVELILFSFDYVDDRNYPKKSEKKIDREFFLVPIEPTDRPTGCSGLTVRYPLGTDRTHPTIEYGTSADPFAPLIRSGTNVLCFTYPREACQIKHIDGKNSRLVPVQKAKNLSCTYHCHTRSVPWTFTPGPSFCEGLDAARSFVRRRTAGRADDVGALLVEWEGVGLADPQCSFNVQHRQAPTETHRALVRDRVIRWGNRCGYG